MICKCYTHHFILKTKQKLDWHNGKNQYCLPEKIKVWLNKRLSHLAARKCRGGITLLNPTVLNYGW